MAQKPDISAEDTLQFLQDLFHQDASELTLLRGGDWSQAYSFMHQQKKYVLRWCHSSDTFENDTIASRLSSEAMPVPQVIASGVKFDTYYAVTEFAAGKFIDTLTADELTTLLPALLNLLDALRTTHIPGTTGYGGWVKGGSGSHQSWKAFLLDVKGDHNPAAFIAGWYAKLAKTPAGTQTFDRLYARFETLVETCPEARELIHSDLLNYNLVVSGAKISGVLDWQCALYGDALYDVAWFNFYEPWFPEFAKIQLGQKLMAHFEAVTAHPASVRERLLCYQLHIGLGSIIYNTAKGDWKSMQEAADYTEKLAF